MSPVAWPDPSPRSLGCQFFITLEKAEYLNRKNTIFGKIEGDTVRAPFSTPGGVGLPGVHLQRLVGPLVTARHAPQSRPLFRRSTMS